MAASIGRVSARIWRKFPRFLPKLPVSEYTDGSKTIWKLSLADLQNGGQFGFNRGLLLSLARGLFFKPLHNEVSDIDSQNRHKSSHGRLSSSPSSQRREYSNGDGPEKGKRSIKLMDFPELIWPHPLKSLRNQFFSLLIRGYFDESYSADVFLKGAEQAVTYISGLISEGNFDGLEGLVSREAIREIRQNFHELDLKQRQFLLCNPADMFFRFIYEIGVIFDDDTNQRFVEITTVFQGIHGFAEQTSKDPNTFFEEMAEVQEKSFVCNYRFIREFTKGKEDDDWTINKLNHFSPKEIVANTSIFRR